MISLLFAGKYGNLNKIGTVAESEACHFHLHAGPRLTLARRTFFRGFFLPPQIQEKEVVSSWRNKMVTKYQRKTGSGRLA